MLHAHVFFIEPNSTLKNTTRVKRQAWTSVAIASFFEGLTEVSVNRSQLILLYNNYGIKSSKNDIIQIIVI